MGCISPLPGMMALSNQVALSDRPDHKSPLCASSQLGSAASFPSEHLPTGRGWDKVISRLVVRGTACVLGHLTLVSAFPSFRFHNRPST